MIYQLLTTDRFDKAFKKLDKQTQRIIKAWIDKNLDGCENPRLHGKGLPANRSGQWRYRVEITGFQLKYEIMRLYWYSLMQGTEVLFTNPKTANTTQPLKQLKYTI